MQIEPTTLPGVLVVTPRRFSDDRGFFCETWNRRTAAAHGIDRVYVQDNQSMSRMANHPRFNAVQADETHPSQDPRCIHKRFEAFLITQTVLQSQHDGLVSNQWRD